jgi:hypothetical protein
VDTEAARDSVGIKCPGTMDDDAAALVAARLSWNGDVCINVKTGWGRRAATPQHAPQLRSACVAENRAVATGKHRRHPSPLLAQPSVPDGENPTMNAVEAA